MKKISLLLTIAVLITSLAGCSSVENGYATLQRERLSVKNIHQEGTVELFYDAALLKPYLVDALEANSSVERHEIEADLTPLTGSGKIQVDYTMDLNMGDSLDSMIMVLDCDVDIDGVKMPVGKVYFSYLNGIYLDRGVLWNLYQVAEVLHPSEDVPPQAYRDELKKILDTDGFIEVMGSELSKWSDFMRIANVSIAKERAFSDAAYEFLQSCFRNYTAGVVSLESGQYQVHATGDTLAKMASQILDYLSKNVDTAYPAFQTMMKRVEFLTGEDSGDYYDQALTLDEKSFLASFLAEAKTYVDDMYQDGQLDFLKPITYQQTLKKEGDRYLCSDTLDLTIQGKCAAYIKSSSVISTGSSIENFPKSDVWIDQLLVDAAELQEKYNPVCSVVLEWKKDASWLDGKSTSGYEGFHEVYPDVISSRQFDWPMSKIVTAVSPYCLVKSQELYVPLRKLCEALGAEVGWDKTAGQAYMVRGTEKIPMVGVIDHEILYVKVRDFEKAGYHVSYDGRDSGLHKATISR